MQLDEHWCDHFWDMLCFKVNVRKPLCSTICNDVYDSHILTGMGHKTTRDFGVLRALVFSQSIKG
jgi:hypothetical protein